MKKLTQEEFIQRCRSVHGDTYDYSRLVYTLSTAKITIICKVHGPFEQVANCHTSGKQGCPACGATKPTDKARSNTDTFVAKAKAIHGDRLNFEKTVYGANNKEKVVVTCPTHGDFSIKPNSILNGQGCSICGKQRGGAARRKDQTQFLAAAANVHGDRYDYSLVEYVNSFTPVKIVCKLHGAFEQKPAYHINSKAGCPKCGVTRANDAKLITFEEFVRQARAVHGDSYEYPEQVLTGTKGDVRIICREHGEFTQRPNNHTNGAGCPKCWSGTSKWEGELQSLLEDAGFDVLTNQRVLGQKEIDVFLPKLNLGIELHGLYWHSERLVPVTAHADKLKLAEEKGIRLLQVFEDEWQQRKEVVFRLILRLCGKGAATGARNLELREITAAEANKLYEFAHVQGAIKSGSRHYGLFRKNGALVAAATFGKSRFERDTWELLRYASKVSVHGGLSRLCKRFMQDANVQRLISYSDRRWFTGDGYTQNGFKWVARTAPGYWWTRGYERISRFRFQKHRIQQVIPGADLSKTEAEIAQAAGYYRIFDAGQDKWELVV